ncbi:MAG: hypothetical protein V8R46_05310 [Eubacterium ramulus]
MKSVRAAESYLTYFYQDPVSLLELRSPLCCQTRPEAFDFCG